MENMVLFLCHLFWMPFLVTLLLEQVSHFISLTCQVKREINTIMNCRGSDQSAVVLETAIFFLTKKCWYFFLFLHQNICCGYSLEVPHWIFIWIQLASRSVSIYAAWLGCFLWPVVSTVAIVSVQVEQCSLWWGWSEPFIDFILSLKVIVKATANNILFNYFLRK